MEPNYKYYSVTYFFFKSPILFHGHVSMSVYIGFLIFFSNCVTFQRGSASDLFNQVPLGWTFHLDLVFCSYKQ